jgi:serine protease Do
LAAACAAVAGCLSYEAAEPETFDLILARAKRRVFPALVFVSPVVEQFEEGERKKLEVVGSGVIISPEGEIVTNRHVVDKAVEIRCLLHDGRVMRAQTVGQDKDTDLALIRLKGTGPFPCAEFADSSDVFEGQFVMAMGAPWGLSRSVSLGIVSCTERFLPEVGEYSLWLQTDASLNPGNSGGPLVDTEGRVVGINTLATMVGGDMGFAVPSKTVRRVIDAIRRDGRVRRAWTGILLQPLKDFKRNTFFDADDGVLVAGVAPGSPAESAGLRVGDRLLSAGGMPTDGVTEEDLPSIRSLLAELVVGEAVELELDRKGSRIALSFTPREKGKVEGDDFDCKDWNMTVKTINKFATPALHYYRNEGVYVQGVRSPGNAAMAGLQRGDVILTVENKEIGGLAALAELYEEIVSDDSRAKRVRMEVLRAGLPRQVVIDYSTKFERE